MERTRVLIADDHDLFRKGLREALAREETIEVVGEAANGDEAVARARLLKPDLVLMDLSMPVCNGLEATRRLQAEMPDTKILVLTMSEGEADLLSAMKDGARGYVLKGEEMSALVHAIRYVARGGIVVSPAMAAKLLREWRGGQAPVTNEPPPGPPVPSEIETQEPTTPPAGDLVQGNIELAIAPPFQPAVVLALHYWLEESAHAEIAQVRPSWERETVFKFTIKDPMPLPSMLSLLPYVAQVTQATGVPVSKDGSPRGPFRIRLLLKAK
ncbi:MAG: response regulator transcription factor [Chloroflexi bacterium]|nr:response regulator transcription factor [Chloroflexota bacterium]